MSTKSITPPPARSARRIHAAEDLLQPDLLAKFERRLDALAAERPELIDYVAVMGREKQKP